MRARGLRNETMGCQPSRQVDKIKGTASLSIATPFSHSPLGLTSFPASLSRLDSVANPRLEGNAKNRLCPGAGRSGGVNQRHSQKAQLGGCGQEFSERLELLTRVHLT